MNNILETQAYIFVLYKVSIFFMWNAKVDISVTFSAVLRMFLQNIIILEHIFLIRCKWQAKQSAPQQLNEDMITGN
jgi:hypothetical protein